MRLIDADVLWNKAEEMYIHTKSGKIIPVMAVPTYTINNTPTIEAEPVRHGRWIPEKTLLGWENKCSVCGNHDNPKTAIKGHYCWFCGTKMDLEGNENA